jgi:hypothetical protein
MVSDIAARLQQALLDVINEIVVPENHGIAFHLAMKKKNGGNKFTPFRSMLKLTEPEYLFLMVKGGLCSGLVDTSFIGEYYEDVNKCATTILQGYNTELFKKDKGCWILRSKFAQNVPCILMGKDPGTKFGMWIKNDAAERNSIVEMVARQATVLRDVIRHEMHSLLVSPSGPRPGHEDSWANDSKSSDASYVRGRTSFSSAQ